MVITRKQLIQRKTLSTTKENRICGSLLSLTHTAFCTVPITPNN